MTSLSYSQNYSANTMAAHPEWNIKVADWNIYATWSAVAIIHHVTIENNSDIEYKNVKVNSAALDEMLVHSKGKRVVPVIVDGSNVIIGFGGT